MLEFKIKLRNDEKKLDLIKLNSNSIKIKLKLTGIYDKTKFKAKVSFIIYLNNNSLQILDLSIVDLEILKNKSNKSNKSKLLSSSSSSSSSDNIWENAYILALDDFMKNNNENLNSNSNEKSKRKTYTIIYNNLKKIIGSIQIIKNNGIINSLIFDAKNSLIRKINLKGYVRKY